MIRRYFLRFLALSPLASLAAVHPARGEIAARAGGPAGAPAGLARALRPLPGREYLLLVRICALRKMVDDGDAQLAALRDEYKGVKPGDPRSKEWFERSDPIFVRTSAIEEQLEDLERKCLDYLRAGRDRLSTGIFSDGTKWEYIRPGSFAQHLESHQYREDELVAFSVVRVPA